MCEQEQGQDARGAANQAHQLPPPLGSRPLRSGNLPLSIVIQPPRLYKGSRDFFLMIDFSYLEPSHGRTLAYEPTIVSLRSIQTKEHELEYLYDWT
jgi:hypothetical protein